MTAIRYDGDGRRLSMTTGGSTSSWTYDSLGRLSSSTRPGRKVAYTWDLGGRLTTIGYPSAGTATLGYNPAGQWTSVTDWNNKQTSFAYGPDEQPDTVTYPNGITAQIVDNPAGAANSVTYSDGGSRVAGWSTARNPDQTLVQVTATGVGDSYDYGYDPDGQLATAADTTNPAGSASYAYDPAGNLTTDNTTTQDFDTSGELCWSAAAPASGSCAAPPAGATTYAYDADGRRSTTTAPSGTSVYGWNAANQLTSTTTPTSGTITYNYDGDGLLTSSVSGSTTTPLTWDETDTVPRLLQQGATSYLYGPAGIPIEQTSSSGGTQWLVSDTTGSVRALTDTTGAVVGTTSYTPWGTPSATTGTQGVLGYAGEPYNPAAGLYYLQARWYDPATGQLLTPDPAFAATLQRYNYADNDPINNTDPAGLFCIVHNSHGGCAGSSVVHDITSNAGRVAHGVSTHWRGPTQGAVIGGIALIEGACIAATSGGCAVAAPLFGGVAGVATYSLSGGQHTAVGYAEPFGEGAFTDSLALACVYGGCGPLLAAVATDLAIGAGGGILSYSQSPGCHTTGGYLRNAAFGAAGLAPIPLYRLFGFGG